MIHYSIFALGMRLLDIRVAYMNEAAVAIGAASMAMWVEELDGIGISEWKDDEWG